MLSQEKNLGSRHNHSDEKSNATLARMPHSQLASMSSSPNQSDLCKTTKHEATRLIAVPPSIDEMSAKQSSTYLSKQRMREKAAKQGR